MRSRFLIAIGVIGSVLSVTALVRTINSGVRPAARGRRVTATRQPYLFRANLFALWVSVIIFVGMLYAGLSELLGT